MISKAKIVSDFKNGLISLDDIVDFVREDAIDEFANELCSGKHLFLSDAYNRGIIKATAMKLKEQK